MAPSWDATRECCLPGKFKGFVGADDHQQNATQNDDFSKMQKKDGGPNGSVGCLINAKSNPKSNEHHNKLISRIRETTNSLIKNNIKSISIMKSVDSPSDANNNDTYEATDGEQNSNKATHLNRIDVQKCCTNDPAPMDSTCLLDDNQEKHEKRHRRSKSTSQTNAFNSCNPILLLTSILLVASALASKGGLFCVCDNQQQLASTLLPISNNYTLHQQRQHHHNQHEAKKPKFSINPTQNKSYKDKLITYLSDEIERKHFSLSVVGKKGRPSKFDNGQDIDFIQLNEHHQPITPAAPFAPPPQLHNDQNQMMNSILQQHYSGHASQAKIVKPTSGSKHQDSAAISDIMKMHELPMNLEANKQQQQQQSKTSPSKRSRAIMGPVKLMASMMMSSGSGQSGPVNSDAGSISSASSTSQTHLLAPRLVSNLLNTYISPYILGMSQAKLSQYADPATIEMVQKQPSESQLQGGSEPMFATQQQSGTSASTLINSLVGGVGRGIQSGFKFPDNPFKLLMGSPASGFLTPPNAYHHRPSNYHRPTTSTTLSPLNPPLDQSSISSLETKPSLMDLKDPLESAESSVFGTVGDLGSEISPNSAESSGPSLGLTSKNSTSYSTKSRQQQLANKWLKNSMMSNLVQGSLRDIFALTQLPIGGAAAGVGTAAGGAGPFRFGPFGGGRPGPNKKLSTAPSVLESNSKHKLTNHEMALGSRIIEELLRFAYILSSGVRTKRDPYVALVNSPIPSSFSTNPSSSAPTSDLSTSASGNSFSQRSTNPLMSSLSGSDKQGSFVQGQIAQKIKSILLNTAAGGSSEFAINKARPRGIMWEMATDPSLAVTVFHLLERASFAVPLGFLLLPFVKMIRSPLAGFDFGRLLPPRASHRSVELEELAKRLDLVDRMLSRALRPSHRDATFMAGR